MSSMLPPPALPPPLVPRQPLQPQHLPPAASSPPPLGGMAANASSGGQPLHWHYGDLDDRNFQVHGRSMILVIVVFSLLLFLTLLCLYARWACRYRRMVITVSTSSAMMGLDGFDSGGGVYTVSVGLDREAIDGIPVILFQPKGATAGAGHKEEPVRCSICLSTFKEEDKVKVLPGCSHMFHPECVDEWLRAQPTCPLCRSSLGGRASAADHERQLGEAAV